MAVMTSSSCCLSVLVAVLTYIVVITADDRATATQLRNSVAPALKNSRAYRLLELETRRQLRNGKYMRFGRASHDDDAWDRSVTDSDLDARRFDEFAEQQKLQNDETRTRATSNRIKNNNVKTSIIEKQNPQQQLRLHDDQTLQSVDKLTPTLTEDEDVLEFKRSRLSNEPGSQFMRFGR